MHVVDFDRYRLRLSLECPLVGAEARTRRAFDVYSAELVRDDETICATAEVYFVRVDDPPSIMLSPLWPSAVSSS